MSLHARGRFGEVGVQLAQHLDPDLDVLALGAPDLAAGRLGEILQVTVLDADEFRLAQGEVEVEVEQAVEGLLGEVACSTTARPPSSRR